MAKLGHCYQCPVIYIDQYHNGLKIIYLILRSYFHLKASAITTIKVLLMLKVNVGWSKPPIAIG